MKFLKQPTYIRYVIAKLSKFAKIICIRLQIPFYRGFKKGLELVYRPHFSKVQINRNIFNHEKNGPKGHQKPSGGKKGFAFCLAIIVNHYLSRNLKFANGQLNTIHLPYKHDPENINEIHMCFLCFAQSFVSQKW